MSNNQKKLQTGAIPPKAVFPSPADLKAYSDFEKSKAQRQLPTGKKTVTK